MKTTIDVADSLLEQAKRLAERKNTTLKAVVEDALRGALAQERKSPRATPLKTHTFRGQGLQAGLAWGDWEDIRALAYEGRGG